MVREQRHRRKSAPFLLPWPNTVGTIRLRELSHYSGCRPFFCCTFSFHCYRISSFFFSLFFRKGISTEIHYLTVKIAECKVTRSHTTGSIMAVVVALLYVHEINEINWRNIDEIKRDADIQEEKEREIDRNAAWNVVGKDGNYYWFNNSSSSSTILIFSAQIFSFFRKGRSPRLNTDYQVILICK